MMETINTMPPVPHQHVINTKDRIVTEGQPRLKDGVTVQVKGEK